MTADDAFARAFAGSQAAFDGLLAEYRRSNAERIGKDLELRAALASIGKLAGRLAAAQDALEMAQEQIAVLEARLELERDA